MTSGDWNTVGIYATGSEIKGIPKCRFNGERGDEGGTSLDCPCSDMVD